MSTPDGDLAVGAWKDARLGSMRGIRKGKAGYGAMVLCENGLVPCRRPATTMSAWSRPWSVLHHPTTPRAIETRSRSAPSSMPPAVGEEGGG